MAYVFICTVSLDGSSESTYVSLKQKRFVEPRLSAATDAAVIRKRRSHDVMGISPVSGQPNPSPISPALSVATALGT